MAGSSKDYCSTRFKTEQELDTNRPEEILVRYGAVYMHTYILLYNVFLSCCLRIKNVYI